MMIETLSGIILSVHFYLTLSTLQILLLCLILYFSERKEENADIAEITEAEVPAPTPAPTLENGQNDLLQEQESQQRTLGDQPVHIVHIRTLFQPGLVDTQYNVGLLRTFVNKLLAVANTLFSYNIHTYMEL